MKTLWTGCLLLLTLSAWALPPQDPAWLERYALRQEAEKRTFKQVKGEVKAGFTDSLTDLAELYYQGIGTKKNYKKAYRYFQKAAQATHSDYALYSQAFMLMRGQGTKPNPHQAFDLFWSLAQNGYPPAALELFRAYKTGAGCEKDEQKARQWLETAANYRLPEALLQLGLETSEENPERAFFLIQNAADLENSRAQYLTALSYQEGVGTAVNARRAFDYMLLSAKQHYPPAQWQTAQWYEQGFGTEASPYQAFRWTRLAAQNGVPQAQQRLAEMYEQGIGTPVQKKWAKQWAAEAKKNLKKESR